MTIFHSYVSLPEGTIKIIKHQFWMIFKVDDQKCLVQFGVLSSHDCGCYYEKLTSPWHRRCCSSKFGDPTLAFAPTIDGVELTAHPLDLLKRQKLVVFFWGPCGHITSYMMLHGLCMGYRIYRMLVPPFTTRWCRPKE